MCGRLGPGGRRRLDADADVDVHRDHDPEPDSDRDRDGHAHCDADTDGYLDAFPHSDRDLDVDTFQNPDPDADAHAHLDVDAFAHPDGDADFDRDVDADDFLIWQSQFGEGIPGGGGGSGPMVDFGNPVRVADVIVSGSYSEHDPYSFETVAGSGAQLRTVPVGSADTISIRFNEHANVAAGDLDIVGLSSSRRTTA